MFYTVSFSTAKAAYSTATAAFSEGTTVYSVEKKYCQLFLMQNIKYSAFSTTSHVLSEHEHSQWRSTFSVESRPENVDGNWGRLYPTP